MSKLLTLNNLLNKVVPKYHKVQDPNAIGSMTGHAEGSKAFARYRKVEIELKKSLTDMLD